MSELLARTQIKDKVIKTISPIAGCFLSLSRAWPVDDKKLPAVLIYHIDDVHDDDNDNDNLAKVLLLSIEVMVKDFAADDDEDTLDRLCLDITKKLEAKPTLDGLCTWSDLTATNFNLSGKGERVGFTAQMIWEFNYRVEKGKPQTIIKN